jgi:hypothetical protein
VRSIASAADQRLTLVHFSAHAEPLFVTETCH